MGSDEMVRREDDDDDRPWRGVFALEVPDDALFTVRIDVRPAGLDEWQPQAVPPGRSVSDERDDLIQKMSPEKRALFVSIKAHREKIGPVEFDIVRELREMRGEG